MKLYTFLAAFLGTAIIICTLGIVYLEGGFTLPFIRQVDAAVPEGAPVYAPPATQTTGYGSTEYDDTALPGVLLPVQNILQKPDLPNGCEATSLAIVLNYYGYGADKIDIAYLYIPREDLTMSGSVLTGPDPTYTYAGDPGTSGGYYCLAPAVAEGANNFFMANGLAGEARNISGAAQLDLCAWLDYGAPVIVWATMDYGPARYCATGWTISGRGDEYIPYANLHCMALVGYTDSDFILCDPLNYSPVYVPFETFMYAWGELGCQAVALAV